MASATHRQSALPHVRSYEAVNSSIFSLSWGQPLHLVVVDPSEHQDGNSREEDEDNDGRHDDDS